MLLLYLKRTYEQINKDCSILFDATSLLFLYKRHRDDPEGKTDGGC